MNKLIIKYCKQCSKELTGQQEIFCSRECKGLSETKSRCDNETKNTGCLNCDKELTGKQVSYCCRKCLGIHTRSSRKRIRRLNGLKCLKCDKELITGQRKFCSNVCKCSYNYEHNKEEYNENTYMKQKERGVSRKIELIKLLGGKCDICAYNKNIASLVFHHIDPSTKLFSLEMREMSSRPFDVLCKEVNKCRLLCANCHNELHYPDLAILL